MNNFSLRPMVPARSPIWVRDFSSVVAPPAGNLIEEKVSPEDGEAIGKLVDALFHGFRLSAAKVGRNSLCEVRPRGDRR